jgi:hypothetical protein
MKNHNKNFETKAEGKSDVKMEGNRAGSISTLYKIFLQ